MSERAAVANLSTVIHGKKFKNFCLRAYGIPENTSDEVVISMIIENDPLPKLQKLEKEATLLRVAIYYGAKDENIPADTKVILLAAALRKAGADVTLELFSDVQHNIYAMGKPLEDRMRFFFSSL